MSVRFETTSQRQDRFCGPRVGLFGLLGSGNLGNDASLEVAMAYLRDHHGDATFDAMCMGHEEVGERYGIEAEPQLWYLQYEGRFSGITAACLKILGKGIDAFHTARWVRRHDIVIVPGTGILECTLPLRASGVPLALFMLCAAGRIFGTPVALVNVGANATNQRLIGSLFKKSAQLATYRSFRDASSRDAIGLAGHDARNDKVYADFVFAIATPPDEPGDPDTVGVGVMAYYGGSDHRGQADAIYTNYIAAMQEFTRWLVDSGRRIRLFWSDHVDTVAVEEIVSDLRRRRPGLDPSMVVAEPFSDLGDMMGEMVKVSTVVATRYHIVLAALKLSKPTIALGYSAKHEVLMEDMGLGDFCQSARGLDVEGLIAQFNELEGRAPMVRATMAKANADKVELVHQQFGALSELLESAGVAGRQFATAQSKQ